MRRSRALLTASLATVLYGGPTRACETICPLPDNVEHALRTHRYVFAGRVKKTEREGQGPLKVTMTVIRSWKGAGRSIVVTNPGGSPACYPDLLPGLVYLAFLRENATLTTCALVVGTYLPWAQEAITRLDKARGFPPLDLPAKDLRPSR